MSFTYSRRIHFQDTDAAGVIFFANAFSMAHEAYEASLAASGIDLKTFFRDSDVAIPVVESRANFFRPLIGGDEIQIVLTPKLEMPSEFSIDYDVNLVIDAPEGDTATGAETASNTQPSRTAIQVYTRHVAIHPTQRKRIPLTEPMMNWIHHWGNG